MREIVRELMPMPSGGMLEDEYDCLVHHILGSLHKGAGLPALAHEIEVQLRDHFSVEIGTSSRSTEQMADAAVKWWTSRPAAGPADA